MSIQAVAATCVFLTMELRENKFYLNIAVGLDF